MRALISVLIVIGAIAPVIDASACCNKPRPRQSHLTPLVRLSPVAGLELDSLDFEISLLSEMDATYVIKEVVANTTDIEITTKMAASWCKPWVDDYQCDHFHASVFVDGRSVEASELDLSAEENQLVAAPTLALNGVFAVTIPAKGRVTVTIKGRTTLTYDAICNHVGCLRLAFSATGWPFTDPKLKPFERFGRHRVRFSWTKALERKHPIELAPKPDRSGSGYAEWGCEKCEAAPVYSVGFLYPSRAKPARHK